MKNQIWAEKAKTKLVWLQIFGSFFGYLELTKWFVSIGEVFFSWTSLEIEFFGQKTRSLDFPATTVWQESGLADNILCKPRGKIKVA